MPRCPTVCFALVLFAAAAEAQERPIAWRVTTPTAAPSVRIGGAFPVTIAATIPDGWKLYSLNPTEGGPVATSINSGDAAFSIDSISAPKPESYPDRNFNIFTEIYTAETSFRLSMRVRLSAKVGDADLPLLVRFQTCTNRYCLPPRTDTLTVALQVLPPRVVAVAAASDSSRVQSVGPSPRSPPLVIVAPTDFASLARFLWLAITMGLLSLMTPCVLPMIPITIAYFGGASQSKGAMARSAIAHAGGIVVAFTLLGLTVSTMLGAGGVLRLAANPALNLAIAALFIVFALNLAGLFEITLPQAILTRASALGSKRHVTGAVLMGAAFAVTSFTCTVPFVGTLLVLASNGTWTWPLVGLAAYGAAFALPFFVLAFAPAMLDKLPRSGAWMMLLKRSLAVAELALAVKFLSNADLVLGVGVLTREVVLVAWIVAAAGVALLWAWPLRSGASSRVAAATGVVVAGAAALWLSRGLTGGALGEIDAYLPPARAETLRGGVHLAWITNDYEDAIRRAKAERRPVLVDFTGYTCTNCRWMEANMFPRPAIATHLDRFVRARLYTDGVGEPYVAQQRLQLDRFGTVALPYYAVVDTNGSTIATFLGMTRDADEFAKFLIAALNSNSGDSR